MQKPAMEMESLRGSLPLPLRPSEVPEGRLDAGGVIGISIEEKLHEASGMGAAGQGLQLGPMLPGNEVRYPGPFEEFQAT